MTHPPPSGADHFKSRWCLKRVMRKKKNQTHTNRAESGDKTGRGRHALGAAGPASSRGVVPAAPCSSRVAPSSQHIPPQGGQRSPRPAPSTSSVSGCLLSSCGAGSPWGKLRTFL